VRGIAPTTQLAEFGIIHESEFIENFVGLTVQQAVSRLNALGFDYEFIGTAGNVISSQFPTAGARATSNGLTVVLNLFDDGSVSLHEVPNVIGQSVDFARDLLIRAGFVPRVVYETHIGYDQIHNDISATIIGQSAANIRLPQGTEILLRGRLDTQ